MSIRPWYADKPVVGVGVAARPCAAARIMTATMGSGVSTRSLVNQHEVGRPKVPERSSG